MAATVSVLPEISEEELTEFRMMLGGEALRPGDPGYDQVRPSFSAMYADRPGLVVLCKGTADVVAAVDFARARGIEVTVRGGGHSVAGLSSTDGGMVIDLAPMNGVLVDKDAQLAYVQGGALWADVDREAQLYGLSTPGGVVSDTGVAGLTLGGGYGWLRRTYGLSCDNVAAYEVVTADGRVLERVRRRELRPVLGAARRRRQLRDRHALHLQAPPGRPDRRLRRRLLPVRGRRDRAARLPRVRRDGAGRGQLHGGRDLVPRGRAPSASGPQPEVHRRRVGLRRRSREGHGGHPAASRACNSAGGHLSADAVPDGAGGVRRVLRAPGSADVLEVDLGERSSRTSSST